MTRKLSLSYWENNLGVILLFGVSTQPSLQDQAIALQDPRLFLSSDEIFCQFSHLRAYLEKTMHKFIVTNHCCLRAIFYGIQD